MDLIVVLYASVATFTSATSEAVKLCHHSWKRYIVLKPAGAQRAVPITPLAVNKIKSCLPAASLLACLA
jgi:hypothetical protein